MKKHNRFLSVFLIMLLATFTFAAATIAASAGETGGVIAPQPDPPPNTGTPGDGGADTGEGQQGTTPRPTAKAYTITFNAGEGTFKSNQDGETPTVVYPPYAAGTPVQLLQAEGNYGGIFAHREGYIITGWLGSDGQEYSLGQTITMPANNLVFNAIWEKVAADVMLTVHANFDGASPAKIEIGPVEAGSTVPLSDVKFERAEHTLLGFASSATAASAGYNTNSSITLNDNMSLYAIWKADASVVPVAAGDSLIPIGAVAVETTGGNTAGKGINTVALCLLIVFVGAAIGLFLVVVAKKRKQDESGRGNSRNELGRGHYDSPAISGEQTDLKKSLDALKKAKEDTDALKKAKEKPDDRLKDDRLTSEKDAAAIRKAQDGDGSAKHTLKTDAGLDAGDGHSIGPANGAEGVVLGGGAAVAIQGIGEKLDDKKLVGETAKQQKSLLADEVQKKALEDAKDRANEADQAKAIEKSAAKEKAKAEDAKDKADEADQAKAIEKSAAKEKAKAEDAKDRANEAAEKKADELAKDDKGKLPDIKDKGLSPATNDKGNRPDIKDIGKLPDGGDGPDQVQTPDDKGKGPVTNDKGNRPDIKDIGKLPDGGDGPDQVQTQDDKGKGPVTNDKGNRPEINDKGLSPDIEGTKNSPTQDQTVSPKGGDGGDGRDQLQPSDVGDGSNNTQEQQKAQAEQKAQEKQKAAEQKNAAEQQQAQEKQKAAEQKNAAEQQKAQAQQQAQEQQKAPAEQPNTQNQSGAPAEQNTQNQSGAPKKGY